MVDPNIVQSSQFIGSDIRRVSTGVANNHRSSIDIYNRIAVEFISNLRYQDITMNVENYITPLKGFLSVHELNATVAYDLKGFWRGTSSYESSRKMDFIRIVLNPLKTEPRYKTGIVKVPPDDENYEEFQVEFRVVSGAEKYPFLDIMPLINEVRMYGPFGVLYSYPEYKDYQRFLNSLRIYSIDLNYVFNIVYDLPNMKEKRRLRLH